MEILPSHDAAVRAGFFAVLLALLVLGELLAPRRALLLTRGSRWLPNLGVGALNIAILKLGLPVLGIGLAAIAESEGWGLFHVLEVPGALSLPLAVIALDLTIWVQHRLFHQIPALWRLHRMHHTDPDFDVTTAVRFHPFEAILSMLIKSAVILLLGVSPLAFLTFEVLLSSTSLFNHANLKLPDRFDRFLRWFLVTPDMHRVHHSVLRHEQNSNFGFNLPWWDRLFGTYINQPRQGHQRMTIGTGDLGTASDQHLSSLLAQPFRTA